MIQPTPSDAETPSPLPQPQDAPPARLLENALHRTFAWNWRKSSGHMLFLNTFLQPRRVSDHPVLPGRATWEAILGETPEKAVERFCVQGVVSEMLPQQRLALVLEEKTVAELTALLQEHNLPLSGRKSELIARLATEAGLKLYHLLPPEPLLRCTPYGERLVLEWLTDPATPARLRDTTIASAAVAVLSWLLLQAIAPELIGSYVYDLLTQVDEPAATALKQYRPRRGAVKQTYITPALKLEWCFVPAGDFWMGSDAGDPQAYDNEKPRHRVYLPAFYIAKYPITNQQYQVFVRATGTRQPGSWQNGRIPRGEEQHPVYYVLWSDAVAFCQWAARVSGVPIRLLTEAEWEKAARGPKGYRYPWGNTWRADFCNAENKIGRTTPVDRYPQGASPYGVLDMAGNVWEWTSSAYQPYPYRADDGRERMSAEDWHVERGGNWYSDPRSARAARRSHPPHLGWDLGFRVGWSAPFSLTSGL